MSAVFDAYDLPVGRLVPFYQRLNKPITYPDGMTTCLGIIYWGREKHLAEIERSIPALIDHGVSRFSDVLHATRTPARSKKLSEQTGISNEILRILKHDSELWLPETVSLAQLDWFQNHQHYLKVLSDASLDNQLSVVSAGQTAAQRKNLAVRTRFDIKAIDEIVKLCDYYRTGKNLRHIRARIYYDMGLDTWQKWAEQTSETIIAMFMAYMQRNPLEGERLIPWPKEVRNGIEWAKMHLEIYAVQW